MNWLQLSEYVPEMLGGFKFFFSLSFFKVCFPFPTPTLNDPKF
jgi:hypothetical protein